MTCWPSYNRSLIRRGGEILFAYDFLDIWDSDLATMNENKEGKKSTDILISLSLSLVDNIRVTFIYHMDKQKVS